MKKLITILGLSLLPAMASATVYNCDNNYPYKVSIEILDEEIVQPSFPPRHTTMKVLKITGEKTLPTPAYARISNGQIQFISNAIYRFLPIDVEVMGAGEFVSESADGVNAAFRVEGGIDLDQDQSIPDLYSINYERGTLHYVVDGRESIKCSLTAQIPVPVNGL